MSAVKLEEEQLEVSEDVNEAARLGGRPALAAFFACCRRRKSDTGEELLKLLFPLSFPVLPPLFISSSELSPEGMKAFCKGDRGIGRGLSDRRVATAVKDDKAGDEEGMVGSSLNIAQY
jgi:hypothetical protein